MASSSCGAHTELASNNSVRVTRCNCGVVHITMLGTGVTVRMSADAAKGLTAGLKAAVDRLDAPIQHGSTTIN